MTKILRAVKGAFGIGDTYGFIGKWHLYHKI